MDYRIRITRNVDGAYIEQMIDSEEVLAARLDLVAHRSSKMWQEMMKAPKPKTEEELAAIRRTSFEEDVEAKKLFQDEYFKSIQPERRSTLQYGEQILPLNPHEPSPFMKKLQDMAKMTPYEREQHQKFERLNLNTFVKDDSNDQSES